MDLSKFADIKSLQKYCENLTQTNQILQQKIATQDTEIKHLKELLTNAPTGTFADKLKVKEDAEEAVLREIAKLNRASMTESLSMDKEEIQKLKMLVESLMAIRNKGQKVEPKKEKKTPTDVNELLKIASQADDEEIQ